MNGLHPLYFLAEAILESMYIKLYHRAKNRGKYTDGIYNSMIDAKDGHIPSPLIMFTSTVLRHALWELQKYIAVPPKASKSTLKADRPHHSNYLNNKKDGGKNASWCAATGRKWLTLPGVADMFTFLMNTWNTLRECYEQRVYKNTLATIRRQIQQPVNPMPAEVISTEAARVSRAIPIDCLRSEVVLEEPVIGSTDPNILIDNKCMDDELHCRSPGGGKNYEHESDEIHESNSIPTTIWQRCAETEVERFDQGTTDVDGYNGNDGDGTDADEEEDASPADDGSTLNLED